MKELSSIEEKMDNEEKVKSRNMAVDRARKQEARSFSLFPSTSELKTNSQVTNSSGQPRALSIDSSLALKSSDHTRHFVQEERIDETLKQLKIDGIEAFSTSRTKFGKIFWIIIIFLASAVLIYEMYKTINNYINSPIVTKYTIRPMSEMEFPEIYICSTNFIKQSKLNNESLKFARFYKSAVSADINQNECIEKLRTNRTVNNFTNIFREQMMNMSYDASEFFYVCMFRQTAFEAISCTDIAVPILDPVYGKCFLLSITDRKQLISAQGLLMFINLHKEEYPSEKCLAPDSIGAMISIGKPFNPTDNQMIYLPPATYNRVDMRAQHLTFVNVNKDGQRCTDDGSFQFSILNVTYSQSACQHDCFLQSTLKVCNCIPILDPWYIREDVMGGIEFCTIEQTRQCIVLNISTSETAMNTINNCSNVCYTSCDIWRYPLRLSSFSVNPTVFTPAHINVSNMIIAMISFTNMEVEFFEQQLSKTVDDLVADIGGQINLWLGASMMTLLQVPILAITLCGWNAYSLAKGKRTSVTLPLNS